MKACGKQLYTLAFIRNNDNVLLGCKKRGFGVGLWNGFGGKVEIHETVVRAAAREIKEECNLTVELHDLKYIGQITFFFEGNPKAMDVRVFTTDKYSGDLKESDEMIPKWYKVKELPYHQMWPDDVLWYPLMLTNNFFRGTFWFRGHDCILKHALKVLENDNELDFDEPPYKNHIFK